jgi:hypothetical protein
MGLHGVEEDGVQLVVEVALVSDPLGVGRPGRVEVGAETAVGAFVDEDGLGWRGGRLAGFGGSRHIDVPHAEVLVGVGDVLGIGRPGGAVEVAGVGTEVDDHGRLVAGLVMEVELVLAGGIGEVGDGFAVGAPGGIALGDTGGLGEVADVALLGRDGKDLAVGLKDGAGSGGREVGILNLFRRDAGEVGREVGQFAVDLNGDDPAFVGGGIKEVNGSELLVDEAAGAGLDGLEVEARVGGGLGDLLGDRVVAEEGDRSRDFFAAVGEEVEIFADPDGVGVVGVLAGDFDQVEGFEVDDPVGGGLAADVVLPGGFPLGDGLIGEGFAIGREGALDAGGQGEGFRHSRTIGMDEEEALEVAVAGRPAGDEDIFAVGGPADDGAAGRVPGDAAGNAPGCWNDVDVGVALEVGGVGDGGSIGREKGAGDDLAVGGEPLGVAALAADCPDVVGIAEGDLFLAQRGTAQQEQGLGRGGLG